MANKWWWWWWWWCQVTQQRAIISKAAVAPTTSVCQKTRSGKDSRLAASRRLADCTGSNTRPIRAQYSQRRPALSTVTQHRVQVIIPLILYPLSTGSWTILARDAQAKLTLIVAQCPYIHLSICVSVRDSLSHAYNVCTQHCASRATSTTGLYYFHSLTLPPRRLLSPVSK